MTKMAILTFFLICGGYLWGNVIRFIEFKAAYDWVPRDDLFRSLDVDLKCPKLIAILQPSTQAQRPVSKE